MEKQRRKEYVEIDLIEIAKSLCRRGWAVILAMVLFAGAAFSYAAFFVTPLYQARALMYVNNSTFSVGNTSVSISPSQLSAAQHLVDTYVVILKTRTTLNKVIEEADLNYSYGQLYKMIQAGPVDSTEVFEIVVTSPDPREAERIANTIADVLPDKISDIVDGSSVRVVDYAVVPSRKASPNITKYVSAGLMLGFLVSCVVLVTLQIFDTTIYNTDCLSLNYDLPVLAVIPDTSSRKSSEGSYYQSGQSEKGRE